MKNGVFEVLIIDDDESLGENLRNRRILHEMRH